MNNKRPVNLKLTRIHFPITAIISILHRLSGLALLIFIPLALASIGSMMASPQSFHAWTIYFSSSFCLRFCIWLFATAVLYHIIAGIRHLLMDAGKVESLRGSIWSARVSFGIWLILVILLGISLWLRIF